MLVQRPIRWFSLREMAFVLYAQHRLRGGRAYEYCDLYVQKPRSVAIHNFRRRAALAFKASKRRLRKYEQQVKEHRA